MSNTLFRPSCVVNLSFRFDESLQIAKNIGSLRGAINSGDVTRRPGQRSSAVERSSRAGNGAHVRIGAVKVEDQFGVRTIDSGPGADVFGTLEPLVLPRDSLTVVMGRVPIKGSFSLPGVRQAGRFDLEFDYRDLPIDCRVARAVGVEIHIGTVSDDDYAAGMAGRTDSTGRLLSTLDTRLGIVDPATGRRAPNGQTLLFYGTVDEWETENDDMTGSRHTMRGRDIRAILLDTKIAGNRDKLAALRLDQPIDRVIADVIATLPSDATLLFDVMTDVSEWPGGAVPSPAVVDGVTRVRRGAAGDKTTNSPSTGEDTRYWDLITQLSSLVGGIPHLVGTAIWIRPGRSIFDIVGDERIPTPFRGGKPRRDEDDSPVRVRRLVHGRDIRRHKIARKFAGVVVPTVEAVSIDDTQRGRQRLLIGRWPPTDTKPSQTKSSADIHRIVVPGICDQARLTAIAQDVYEEIGRGEIGGNAETNVCSSFGGDNTDPDLLRLRPTDAIELLVDVRALSSRAPLISELTERERSTFAQEVEHLTEVLGDKNLARVLVAIRRGAIVDHMNFYRVASVQMTWSASEGASVAFDFQNYIVARHRDATTSAVASKTRKVRKTRVGVKGEDVKRLAAPNIEADSAADSEEVWRQEYEEQQTDQRLLNRWRGAVMRRSNGDEAQDKRYTDESKQRAFLQLQGLTDEQIDNEITRDPKGSTR